MRMTEHDDQTDKQEAELSKDEVEARKFSATAGGGLLGFAFGGPIGALTGIVIGSIASSVYFAKNHMSGDGE